MLSSSAAHNDYLWYNDISAEENALDLKLRLQSKINWFDSVLKDIPSAYASFGTLANSEYVNSKKLSLSFDKSKNALSVTTKDTVPSLVKVFADGNHCCDFVPDGAKSEIVLPFRLILPD